MSKKYKATGCARLVLILIILAPLTYIGASYINGENGIENFKKLIRLESWGGSKTEDNSKTISSKEAQRLEARVEQLEKANKELQKEIEYYKQKLQQVEQE